MANEPGRDEPVVGRRSPEAAIEEAVALWVDRLNRGEELDELEVLARHPGIGHEVLDRLQSFVGLVPEAVHRPVKRLGDFRLVRELGRGGMGVVYEAHQESMDRTVALKILPAGVAADRAAFLRFLREAQTAGKLRHPAIVGVYSLGVEAETPYYAMEHVEGETLGCIIEQRRRGESPQAELFFPPGRSQTDYLAVARAFAEVAEGLHHAHRVGVTHRDVKPSNLMLDAEDRLRIVDFGLAYFEGMTKLTLTGEIVGTPLYMSPEQARRESISVDHRADIYSLGATLYEVLTLHAPFEGADRHDILRQIVEGDLTSLRARAPLVPVDLETIVLQSMRRDPCSRYSTAQAMAQDLLRFVRGEPIEARPESAWIRRARRLKRQRVKIIVGLTFVAAMVALIWLIAARSRAERDRELALYPGRIRAAVGNLDSGSWILHAASRPLDTPGIDFQVFEADDFRDVVEIGGSDVVTEAMEDLQELSLRVPEQPEAYYHLARGLIAVGRSDDAVQQLERALAADSTFVPAAALHAEVTRRKDYDAARLAGGWIEPWRTAQRLAWQRDPEGKEKAETAVSELIARFETDEPPYTGFLTECYLLRAKIRLELRNYDLAAEDCVFARALHPKGPASELLLGRIYLASGRPDAAREAFDRLRARSEHDVVPFWVVSVYLSTPRSNVLEAFHWARLVRDRALQARLAAYLCLRLGRWNDAVYASEEAVQADPNGLVPRQLLTAALVKKLFVAGDSGVAEDLAQACRSAIDLDPESRRSRYLLRAAREVLRGHPSDEVAKSAIEMLESTATGIGLHLPSDSARVLVDDFSDGRFDDGRPFDWRVISECCPAELRVTSDGLRFAKAPKPGVRNGWIVTDEVFSGEQTLRATADVGAEEVSASLHVDLGTVSLYFGGVSRRDDEDRCYLGRFEYGRVTEHREIEVDWLVESDVEIEMRSVGESVELRVWPTGDPRPDGSTLALEDAGHRLGSIGLSSHSRSAVIRRVELHRHREQ